MAPFRSSSRLPVNLLALPRYLQLRFQQNCGGLMREFPTRGFPISYLPYIGLQSSDCHLTKGTGSGQACSNEGNEEETHV